MDDHFLETEGEQGPPWAVSPERVPSDETPPGAKASEKARAPSAQPFTKCRHEQLTGKPGGLTPSSRTTFPSSFGWNSFLHAFLPNIPGAGVLSRTPGKFCQKGSGSKSKGHLCWAVTPLSPRHRSSARERAERWHVRA